MPHRALKDGDMEEQRRERKATTEVEVPGEIYYRASRNDTANKTSLSAAILAKHLETCDCSSFVAEAVGQLGKTCAELTLVARRKTAKHLDRVSVSVALNVKL